MSAQNLALGVNDVSGFGRKAAGEQSSSKDSIQLVIRRSRERKPNVEDLSAIVATLSDEVEQLDDEVRLIWRELAHR